MSSSSHHNSSPDGISLRRHDTMQSKRMLLKARITAELNRAEAQALESAERVPLVRHISGSKELLLITLELELGKLVQDTKKT